MPVLAPHDVAVLNRHPKLIFTNATAEPIEFTNDIRFDPDSLVKEVTTETVVERDYADYAVIDLGVPNAQIYVVEMYTTVYSRQNFKRVFNQTIEALKNAESA
jgi:hypothetical protein